jgi:hypothetical protein
MPRWCSWFISFTMHCKLQGITVRIYYFWIVGTVGCAENCIKFSFKVVIWSFLLFHFLDTTGSRNQLVLHLTLCISVRNTDCSHRRFWWVWILNYPHLVQIGLIYQELPSLPRRQNSTFRAKALCRPTNFRWGHLLECNIWCAWMLLSSPT